MGFWFCGSFLFWVCVLARLKKFVDKRDWREYNRRLVDRGAFLFDMPVLEHWDRDLERLNRGKMYGGTVYGKPFEFPDILFYWAAMQHAILGMPYRQIQGYLEKYFEGTGVRVPDYTTLYKRIRALKFDIEVLIEKKD